jgi:hypothetical protein
MDFGHGMREKLVENLGNEVMDTGQHATLLKKSEAILRNILR